MSSLFYRNVLSLKHNFCHFVTHIRSHIHRFYSKSSFWIMADTICIIKEIRWWLDQLQIYFIVFFNPKNIGFVTLLHQFNILLTDFCFKNDFCTMTELICRIRGICWWQNQFQFVFIVFRDPKTIGFVILFGGFHKLFTKICLKNEFWIMAYLICILGWIC